MRCFFYFILYRYICILTERRYLKSENIPFFYYHPTLILLLQLVLSLYLGDFCFADSFCSSNDILCSCFIEMENILRRMTFLFFCEADSAGQMCSVFAFPPMII